MINLTLFRNGGLDDLCGFHLRIPSGNNNRLPHKACELFFLVFALLILEFFLDIGVFCKLLIIACSLRSPV